MAEHETTAGGKLPNTAGKVRTRRGEAAIAGFDPFQHLLQRALTVKDPYYRDKLAIELLPYVKPKMKAVEHSGGLTTTIRIIIGGDEG